jgi:hypothetical protein
MRTTLIAFSALVGLIMGAQSTPAGGAEQPTEALPTAQAGDVTVQIARWFDDKAAAVGLSFEASQAEVAAPLLKEYGMVGTFAVDPEGESAGSDVDAVTARLERAIEDGEWISFHFGEVDDGFLRDAIRALYGQRRNLWFGEIAEIRKYEVERKAATVAAEMVGEQKVRIEVDCDAGGEMYDQPLTVKVDLPRSWPGDDVQALGADGEPIAIRRTTENWNLPLIAVPPRRGTYYVQVVEPRGGKPEPTLPVEAERSVWDAATGMSATICKWFDGRQTAHSIRFDDSHPTHILHVIPLLREYGYKGTFMINPGKSNYENHREAWEACAAEGDQEFTNHTHHHRGCTDDEDADRELGDCSRYIWSQFPDKSKLLVLARGGATTWTTTRPFRYWLDKYHLVTGGRGSVSMADEYGPRLPLFERRLAEALADGSWFPTHYHAIGEGHLSMTEENFARVLEITKDHEDQLWIAGMGDIHKYEEERNAASLSMESDGANRAMLRVHCGTDAELYDQPLTIQLVPAPPRTAESIAVKDARGEAVPTRTAAVAGQMVLRFEVAPVDGTYSIVAR